jgi:hypothetical protein
MAAIITKTHATTPIGTLILKVNNLTQVPANLKQYTQLTSLSLTQVPTGLNQ